MQPLRAEQPKPVAFGAYLTWCLTAQRLTQTEFAKRIGWSQSNLNAVIKGKRKPPLPAMKDWCRALRLTREEEAYFVELALEANDCAYVAAIVHRLRKEAKV